MPHPYYNSPQQNPRDERLAELAAIAQLYGAVSGPQEQAARAQQQNALAVLGLMQQAQSQQAHEAFQQQQLGAEQQHWQTESDVQRQGHEEHAANQKEHNQILADDLKQREQAGKYGDMNMFFGATPEKQEELATAMPDHFGTWRNNIHNAEVEKESADPVKQALFANAMKTGGMKAVGQTPNLMSLHPDVLRALATHLETMAAPTVNTPTQFVPTHDMAPSDFELKPPTMRSLDTGKMEPFGGSSQFNPNDPKVRKQLLQLLGNQT